MSSTYDGIFNMYTGQQNMSNLGNLHTWNYDSHTSFFDDKCADVVGNTGELLPPLVDSSTLSVFATDLCRYVETKSCHLHQQYHVSMNKLNDLISPVHEHQYLHIVEK